MNLQHRIVMLRTKLIKTPKDKERRNSLIFNCLYTNDRSLSNKQAELELLIYEHKHNLVGITETWEDDSHDWNVKINIYASFRKDHSCKIGRGVALFHKKNATLSLKKMMISKYSLWIIWCKDNGCTVVF